MCALGQQTTIQTITPKPVTPVSSIVIKTAHAKIHNEFHGPKKILEEISAGRDVNTRVQTFILIGERDKNSPPPPSYPDHNLVSFACYNSDTVVVGSFTASESSIVEAGDFLFTDSSFHVESVVKGQINPGDNIIVTRPGGRATVNGHSVTSTVGEFPLFSLNTRYALLLRYLPETKTYLAFRGGAFSLGKGSQDSVRATDTEQPAIASFTHESNFLTELRAAVTAPCSK